MQKITPFLWFDDNAEDAIEFYMSVFPDSRLVRASRHGDAGPGGKAKLFVATFELAGQTFMALNGGPHFKFTEAISLYVDVATQAELDRIWDAFLDHGGTATQCGWLKDRYGLSWQIVPSVLGELLRDKDPAVSGRVMQAMLKMVRLDIAALQAAARG